MLIVIILVLCLLISIRSQIFHDGLEHFSKPGLNYKNRFSVTFIAPDGREEVGIDVGGVFKEFWTTLSSVVFDVSYGLFVMNNDNLIYTNPNAGAIVGSDEYVRVYTFLGRVLGKAVFEGITIQVRYTHILFTYTE